MVWLSFAEPSLAQQYCDTALRPEDQARLNVSRAPRAERDWRVSRALDVWLRQHLKLRADMPRSLSHSHGQALLAYSAQPCGVDLERCRARDFTALAEWIGTPFEQQWLRAAPTSQALMLRFYLLWTLKEASLKAHGADFPADMRAFGLGSNEVAPRLRASSAGWCAVVYQLAADDVAAVVWRPSATQQVQLGRTLLDQVRWCWPGRVRPLRVLGAWDAQGLLIGRLSVSL